MGSPLSSADVDGRMSEIPQWRHEGDRLRREFRFADFPSAIAFMTRCAFTAEAMNHHPDWKNVYNRVDVELWTHDAGGITNRDFELAKAMDAAATNAR